MKDLKGFLEAIYNDKKLAEKVNEAKDVKEMVKIANEAGYAVTEDEMNDFLMEAVAGGKATLRSIIKDAGSWFEKTGKKAGKWFKKAGNDINDFFTK